MSEDEEFQSAEKECFEEIVNVNSFKSYSLSPRKKGNQHGVNWKFEKIKNLAPTSVSSKKPDTKNISFQVNQPKFRPKIQPRSQINLMEVIDSSTYLPSLRCIVIMNRCTKSKKLWEPIGQEIDNILLQFSLILHLQPDQLAPFLRKSIIKNSLRKTNAILILISNLEIFVKLIRLVNINMI